MKKKDMKLKKLPKKLENKWSRIKKMLPREIRKAIQVNTPGDQVLARYLGPLPVSEL